MTGQYGRDLVQQIQIGTHSAFCTSGALPITANTMAQTLACVLPFASSQASFGTNFRGLCVAQGPSRMGGDLAPVHTLVYFAILLEDHFIFFKGWSSEKLLTADSAFTLT